MARFADHALGVETCLFGLDGSDDVAAVVTAALRARVWECVVIGGGVRGQLELFEQVVVRTGQLQIRLERTRRLLQAGIRSS